MSLGVIITNVKKKEIWLDENSIFFLLGVFDSIVVIVVVVAVVVIVRLEFNEKER